MAAERLKNINFFFDSVWRSGGGCIVYYIFFSIHSTRETIISRVRSTTGEGVVVVVNEVLYDYNRGVVFGALRNDFLRTGRLNSLNKRVSSSLLSRVNRRVERNEGGQGGEKNRFRAPRCFSSQENFR